MWLFRNLVLMHINLGILITGNMENVGIIHISSGIQTHDLVFE